MIFRDVKRATQTGHKYAGWMAGMMSECFCLFLAWAQARLYYNLQQVNWPYHPMRFSCKFTWGVRLSGCSAVFGEWERYLSLEISLDCQHVFISLLLLFLVHRMQRRYNKSGPNRVHSTYTLRFASHQTNAWGAMRLRQTVEPADFLFRLDGVCIFFLVPFQ